MLLEAAHGWKVSAVLDDELTRTLLRLGHAHGVGLALLAIVHGELATPLFEPDGARRVTRAMQLGATLIPLGFALGALGHPEGDPSVLVVLVPIGAIALIDGLTRTVAAVWR